MQINKGRIKEFNSRELDLAKELYSWIIKRNLDLGLCTLDIVKLVRNPNSVFDHISN